MTEPNIVYIGDEVRHTRYGDDTAEWVVCGAAGPLASLCSDKTDWAHAKEFTTPDGRPVDGFGGAKITLQTREYDGVWSFDAIVNGVLVYEDCPSGVEALECGVWCAQKLYGEWVREPTEADLKRRGLL